MTRNTPGAAKLTFALVLTTVCPAASYGQPPVAIPDGYATQNGGTTGGGNATPVKVSTASAFKSAVDDDTPAVIVVKGKLNVGSANIGSNKTIIGADVNSGLHGGTIKVRDSNIIFQNLTFGPASGDAMELSGAKNIFITKCEFHDSSDELCSIVRESDYVTVSWCKFYFDKSHSHAFGGLIGNRDDRTSDRGKLHVTMHHNWYAEGVRGRMPRVRYGHVHIYNNFYNSAGSGYCIGTGFECHIRLENTCFEDIDTAWRDQAIGALASGGEIGWKDLAFVSAAQPTYIPNRYPVFKPPYSFNMDKVEDVKRLVADPTYGAGNRLTRHQRPLRP
jgi:pectate lyase